MIIAPHAVKKRRMCQHRKRAVARRALIRDDQNPLPLPVKGSTPECIAWAGIAEAMGSASVEENRKETKKQRWGFSTHPSLPIYQAETSSWRLLPTCCSHSDETGAGSLATLDQASRCSRHATIISYFITSASSRVTKKKRCF